MAISLVVLCRTTTTIRGPVLCDVPMALCGVAVPCITTSTRGIVFGHAAMEIGIVVIGSTATEICGIVVCHSRLLPLQRCHLLCPFGNMRHHCLPHHHKNARHTQQSAERGTCSKDASDRGEATGNNQPACQKDKRAAQHKCQRDDNNAAVVAMVTTMTGSGGGEDNGSKSNRGGHNQQSTQSSSRRNGGNAAAAAMETTTATEMVTVAAKKLTPMPTMGYQQKQQGQRIRELACGKRLHCHLGLPPPAATAAAAMQICWWQWGQQQLQW